MLRFRLFDMPVVVRASFLLVAALIGFAGGFADVSRTIAWVVIVFISILVHELGHAFAARRFGSQVAIEINGLGGLTRWSVDADLLTPGRRAFIAAAGSAVGVTLGGAVWLIGSAFGPYQPFVAFALDATIYVNLFWGLLNWLPVRPLDGGHLLESLLQKIAPVRAKGIATVVFIATAAAGLGLALWQRRIFIALIAGWLLLNEVNLRRPAPAIAPPRGLPTFTYDDDPEQSDEGSSN